MGDAMPIPLFLLLLSSLSPEPFNCYTWDDSLEEQRDSFPMGKRTLRRSGSFGRNLFVTAERVRDRQGRRIGGLFLRHSRQNL